jgi:Cytochrome P450
LHDREVFNNPEEFQPERYLKDGKLNPDVRDPDCAAFGFGRRSVNATIYFPTYASLILPPVYVLADI